MSADFDTTRIRLGLSMEEARQVCGVKNVKTINRWKRGEQTPGDGHWAALHELEETMNQSVDQVIRMAACDALDGAPLLRRYRTRKEYEASALDTGLPYGAHAMMIAWAQKALLDKGYPVNVVWEGENHETQ